MANIPSRRQKLLNRSVNKSPDLTEDRTADPSGATGTRASKRSGTAGSPTDEMSVKMPRMTQKQRPAHAMTEAGLMSGAAIARPLAPREKSFAQCPQIWSQHIQTRSAQALREVFQTRYALSDDNRVYKEASASLLEEKAGADQKREARRITMVEMGELKTVTGDDLIQTLSMSDCSSIVLLTDFDPEKKTYGKRSLVHIQGSHLPSMAQPEQVADTLCSLAKASTGEPLMVLVTGTVGSAFLFETMVLPVELSTKGGAVRQPLMELMALCNTKILPLTCDITVCPDGSLVATHNYTNRDGWIDG